MESQEFIRKMQQFAGLEDEEQATKVTGAVLETLGERLPLKHRDHLAAQLPAKLRAHVLKREPTKPFVLENFYNRVGVRADISYHRAVHGSLAVIKALQEAVAPGELNDIVAELPQEYGELFGRKQPGPASPSSVQ